MARAPPADCRCCSSLWTLTISHSDYRVSIPGPVEVVTSYQPGPDADLLVMRMMCLLAGVCVTNGLLLPGYLRLAMELQSQARVDKYCWHHAHSQRLPCPAGLCQPQPGLAMLRSVRAGSGEARPGHWSPGLGGCQSPLVSEYDAASAHRGCWPGLLCISWLCLWRGQRPDGTQDAGQPRNGQSPAISRRRLRLRTRGSGLE